MEIPRCSPISLLVHPPLSRRHIPQRQIRIPIQNTRRKLQLNNPAGQIPPRDLTTLLRLPRKIKKLSPRNIPQIHIHKPLNNLPSPPRLKRRIQKRQNHIITHTTLSPPKPKPRQPSKRPPSKPNQQTSEALTQATSTHIRSPSLKPHQHTSEAHLSTHISTHPKLFSQPSSTHIRSPSLKPHQHTSEALLSSHISIHPKLFSQATSAYIRSSSLNPHQHTSEAHLSSHISTHPKLISQVPQNSHQNSGYQSTSQSVNLNQSGQPSFSIIIIQNTPKINLNITQKHHTLSKTASIPQSPHNKSQKTHPTHIQRSADATPPPGTSQGNSAPAAIQRSADVSPPPGKPPHLTPPKTRTDSLPARRLHGRAPVRRSKPLVILGAWGF